MPTNPNAPHPVTTAGFTSDEEMTAAALGVVRTEADLDRIAREQERFADSYAEQARAEAIAGQR